MIGLARAKFPPGRFQRGSGYELDFAANSLDLVAAFEVVIHIPDVGGFVKEMFRVAREAVIFSAWMTPKNEMEAGQATICGAEFINRRYTHRHLMNEIARALPAEPLTIDLALLRHDCWAYVLRRGQAGGGHRIANVSLIPGYLEGLAKNARSQVRPD